MKIFLLRTLLLMPHFRAKPTCGARRLLQKRSHAARVTKNWNTKQKKIWSGHQRKLIITRDKWNEYADSALAANSWPLWCMGCGKPSVVYFPECAKWHLILTSLKWAIIYSFILVFIFQLKFLTVLLIFARLTNFS
jgi:hypothetical protein